MSSPYGDFNMTIIVDFLNFIKNDNKMKTREVWEEWKVAIKQFLLMNGNVLAYYKGYSERNPRFPPPKELAFMIFEIKSNISIHIKSAEERFMVDLWMWVHH